MLQRQEPLDTARLRQLRERTARSYDDFAVLHRTLADRLMERLALFRISPRTIIDANAATGYLATKLRGRFTKARILLLDDARSLLQVARQREGRFFSAPHTVCAELDRLPFQPSCCDLLVSNLGLCNVDDVAKALSELRQVITESGLFIFTSFGPGTLQELRSSWANCDSLPHVHSQLDMHDLGDALIRAGFSSPVLDIETFVLTYAELSGLFRDLVQVGATNVILARRRTLTGRRRFEQMHLAYEQYRENGVLPATFEVVHGHAWIAPAGTRPQDGSTVAAFPFADLLKTLPKRP